jgi:quinoprotein glucose dehydrogenase
MANGLLYLPTPYNRVVALEPETGRVVWEYLSPSGGLTLRGVEYWAGDAQTPAMVIFTAADKLVEVSAKTGVPNPAFGAQGLVDLRQGVDNGFTSGQLSLSSPPKVFKNLIITGLRVQESPSLGYAGDTRAWDVHTGKLVWQLHSVPRPGEPGHDTWSGDDWKGRSGTNVWGFISVDAQLGLVYLPYGSPTFDFWGGDRPGAGLYGDSLVAVEGDTGKVKWYFQAIPHDTWDYDFSAAPVLFTFTRGNERIPAVAEVSKQGLVYILDRRDGKPIFGMDDRPVPPSDVPGEHAWPTVPFPKKPAPLGRMSFSPDDLANVTPEHHKYCADLLASEGGMHNDGPFTRYGTTLSIVFPGTLGASNWHGASIDPQRGLLFVNVIQLADIGKMAPNAAGARTPYSRTAPGGAYARFWWGEKYWPCQAPPWGQFAAINVTTGDVAWKVPLGVVEELDAKGIHNTGTMNMGGSIATASGLVFIGATNDRRFRAFDAGTGNVLWETTLEAGAYATPMTYQGRDGKQYVVIVAAGAGYYDRVGGDSVIAFALK